MIRCGFTKSGMILFSCDHEINADENDYTANICTECMAEVLIKLDLSLKLGFSELNNHNKVESYQP